jgi:energy-coupling factor transporter ATP-binding protein EcfA2
VISPCDGNDHINPILNPFVLTGPVDFTSFFQREDIIRSCQDGLAGPVRSPIAILGEHGFGKTSLLRYLEHIMQEEKWGQPQTHLLPLYTDCSIIEPFTPTSFWRGILQQLNQSQSNFDLQIIIDGLLLRGEINAFDLKVMGLCDRLKEQNTSLVLLLDEFDTVFYTTAMDRAAKGSFLTRLRGFHDADPDCTTLVTSTREPLHRLCSAVIEERHGSPFFNMFNTVSLSPFSLDEIDALLEQVRERTGVEFDWPDRDFLASVTGGHPALLQKAGYYLFAERRRAPLTNQSAQEIVKEFEKKAGSYFSLFWNRSSPLEQSLLILIILSYFAKRSFPPLEITPEDIHNFLQRYQHDLWHLEERGLIQEKEDTYQISSISLAKWIVRTVACEDEGTLAERYQRIADKRLSWACQTLKKLTQLTILERVIRTLDEPLSGRSGVDNIMNSQRVEQDVLVTHPAISRHSIENTSTGQGEREMLPSEQSKWPMLVLTQAVIFLFDEARKLLDERRQRRQQMKEHEDMVTLPSGVEESAKQTILDLKPVNLDNETAKEINHLRAVIAVHEEHRRHAEKTIATYGGILNATPRERAQLENAENEILKHTQRLKKLLEKVYDQPIHINGLK